MRQLKHHEQKLLKKVNFLRWKNEHNLRELQVSRAGAAGSWTASQVSMTAAAAAASSSNMAMADSAVVMFLLLHLLMHGWLAVL